MKRVYEKNANTVANLRYEPADYELKDNEFESVFNDDLLVDISCLINEQLREGMILTRLDAKLRLIERGLYTQINDAILAMPDCVLKIKWTEADTFKRTDVDLCDFLYSLGMTDEEIDELFNN